MRFSTAVRVLRDRFSGSPRELYWTSRVRAAELAAVMRSSRRTFRAHALRDQIRYLAGAIRPVGGDADARAHAAAAWLLRAQAMTSDGGVSYGYFPCRGPEWGWKPSYPETTGYIMSSLLAYGARFRDQQVGDAVLRMAHWEADIQMPSGAVQGGPVCAPEKQTPAAFNTGMVLDGWCSVYATLRDPRILGAARRAANWLVADLDDQGYFRTNGAYVSAGEIKIYTSLCAWALYRFGDIVGEDRYRMAAVRTIEAAIRQQHANGWFAHNCLERSEAPLTHTIGYTLQGITEVGALAGRDDFLGAAAKTLDALMPRASESGYLAGCFYSDWEPAVFSACLTGSAQIAIVAYRLHALMGNPEYGRFADRLLDWLKGVQALDTADENVNGALAGSFPIFGDYMRGGYPNWATKYLLDALLLQVQSRGMSGKG